LNFLYNRFAANWKIRMNTSSIATSIAGLKCVVPEYVEAMRSFPFVSGEKYARYCSMPEIY
jgi:hypothetical protein